MSPGHWDSSHSSTGSCRLWEDGVQDLTQAPRVAGKASPGPPKTRIRKKKKGNRTNKEGLNSEVGGKKIPIKWSQREYCQEQEALLWWRVGGASPILLCVEL